MRYIGKDFPLQDPTETCELDFDFSRHPEWKKWDGASSVTTAVTVVTGTDVGSANRISGNAPTYCGPIVKQKFANPVNAVKYKLAATVVTQCGETLALYSHVTGKS